MTTTIVTKPAPTRLDRIRRRVYEIIEMGRGEDTASKAFDTFIVTLILLNIAAFAAETVPALEARYRPQFLAFEIFSVAVFTIEYLARLWVAVEVPFLARETPLRARLSMARRPALIIDLLAILPFYLAHMFAIDLRVLRILRLLRFLKLSRYSPALHTLMRVLSNERRALMGAGLLLMACDLVCRVPRAGAAHHGAVPLGEDTASRAPAWRQTPRETRGISEPTELTGGDGGKTKCG